MLQFRQVQKTYGPKKILDIPLLDLDPGIYWLQGANGSGKTSLLRMLAGILPFEGSIVLDGINLKKQPVAYRRTIGWADAEPLYPGFLTGHDLLAFYRDIHPIGADRMKDLVSRFGLHSWLSSRAASWSAGMTKRISLLLAFCGKARLLALDEPLITLDQQGVSTLFTLILEQQRQDDRAIFLLSSHQDISQDQLPGIRKMTLKNNSIQLVYNEICFLH